MASLREMRRRLSSVRSIRQITKAMKMVAAAKLRRAQDSILAARPYAQRLADVLQDIAARHDVSATPLLMPSGGSKVVLVVISADKGLCGGFNTNIFRRAGQFLRNHSDREVEIIAVGKKCRDYFTRRNFKLRRQFTDVFRALDFSLATTIRDEVIDPFLDKEVGEVHLVYNEFKSVAAQEVVCRQLLPVIKRQVTEFSGKSLPVDFEYEPNAEEVFTALLPEYFAIQFWRALLESYSAEMAARMTSMDAATKNANDMIGRLTLVSNRLRQASITQEIAEIVGGAEALK